MSNAIHKIRKKVKEYLDQDRYEHTLGVMYTSASLAMCYGEDVNDAMIAGLLHDCAKCIPPKKKIRLCKKYHIHITESEYANPSLLHAKLGAYIAAEKYHQRSDDSKRDPLSYNRKTAYDNARQDFVYCGLYRTGEKGCPTFAGASKTGVSGY